MTELFAEMQADATAAPDSQALTKIGALAERQVILTAELADLENQVELKKAALRKVQEDELPTAMQECHISEFKLTNGAKITVKKFYSGSIGDGNRSDCFTWLEKHGHDDLIKNDFTIAFGKGEDDKAADFEKRLQELDQPYKHKKHVHPQTLNAFIKEQVETGAEFPLETFNVFIGNRAIIK